MQNKLSFYSIIWALITFIDSIESEIDPYSYKTIIACEEWIQATGLR